MCSARPCRPTDRVRVGARVAGALPGGAAERVAGRGRPAAHRRGELRARHALRPLRLQQGDRQVAKQPPQTSELFWSVRPCLE